MQVEKLKLLPGIIVDYAGMYHLIRALVAQQSYNITHKELKIQQITKFPRYLNVWS